MYTVLVTCISLAACPIPKGYAKEHSAANKQYCEQKAKQVIEAYGYKAKDFRIVCREKN